MTTRIVKIVISELEDWSVEKRANLIIDVSIIRATIMRKIIMKIVLLPSLLMK
jgi:hypothetical protein